MHTALPMLSTAPQRCPPSFGSSLRRRGARLNSSSTSVTTKRSHQCGPKFSVTSQLQKQESKGPWTRREANRNLAQAIVEQARYGPFLARWLRLIIGPPGRPFALSERACPFCQRDPVCPKAIMHVYLFILLESSSGESRSAALISERPLPPVRRPNVTLCLR